MVSGEIPRYLPPQAAGKKAIAFKIGRAPLLCAFCVNSTCGDRQECLSYLSGTRRWRPMR